MRLSGVSVNDSRRVVYFYTGNKFYSSIFPVWARGVYSETLSKRWTTSRRSGTKRWCIVTALKRALFITWCVLLQSNIHRYSPTVTGFGAITPCIMILAEWQAHRTKTGADNIRRWKQNVLHASRRLRPITLLPKSRTTRRLEVGSFCEKPTHRFA